MFFAKKRMFRTISAQAYLLKFYGELGFESVSEIYMEDDIPHIEMLYIFKN